MRIESLALVGAGGHGRVVCDAVRIAYPHAIIEVWDRNTDIQGAELLGVRIRTPVQSSELPHHVHVSIGDNRARKLQACDVVSTGRMLLTVVHPSCNVSTAAGIASGCFLAAGAIVAAEAIVGECVIINHGAIVDHDCRIGAWTHIAPGSTLGGMVEIGQGTLIGTGAIVLPGVKVGDWCIVGAGSVVTRDVPSGATVIGSPARVRG